MSRKVQTPVTLACPGCGLHYLTRTQVMEILSISRGQFYRLPICRCRNGLIRCDRLRQYIEGTE
jgi:hypothetical protein